MDFLRQPAGAVLYAGNLGICDNQDSTPAYVDTDNPQEWVATVENRAQLEVIFTAIDKCVLQDGDQPGRGRCDGMLTTNNLLYLVELKEQRTNWRSDATEQLRSTILFCSNITISAHTNTRKPLAVINAIQHLSRLTKKPSGASLMNMAFARSAGDC